MKYLQKILLLTLLISVGASVIGQQDSRADKYMQAVSEQFDMNKGL